MAHFEMSFSYSSSNLSNRCIFCWCISMRCFSFSSSFSLCYRWYSLNKSVRLSLLWRALLALDLLTSLRGVSSLSNDGLRPSVEDATVSPKEPELELVRLRSSLTGPALFEQTATGFTEGVMPKISLSSSKYGHVFLSLPDTLLWSTVFKLRLTLSTRVAISFLLHLLRYFLPQSFLLWLFVFEKVFPFFVQRQKKQHLISWPFNLQWRSFKFSDWS